MESGAYCCIPTQTLEHMPRSPDTTGSFSKGVLALTTDVASEKYYGQGPSFVDQAGWAHAWWADHKRWNRSINLLGTKDTLYYLRDWECLRPPANVTLHQKQVSQHYTTSTFCLFFFANQLSSVSPAAVLERRWICQPARCRG